MNSNKVTTIDSFDCTFGAYNIADYFVDGDYSNQGVDRFAPINVSDPETKILKDKIFVGKKSVKK